MSSAHSGALPTLPGTDKSRARIVLPYRRDDYTYQVTDACGADNAITPFKILKYENPTVTVDVVNICFGAGQAIVMGVNKNELSPTTYNYSIAAGPTRVGDKVLRPILIPILENFSSLESEGNYTICAFNDGCKPFMQQCKYQNTHNPPGKLGLEQFVQVAPPLSWKF